MDMNICKKCGVADSYESAKNINVLIFPKMCIEKRKTIYHLKYHIENVINTLTENNS